MDRTQINKTAGKPLTPEIKDPPKALPELPKQPPESPEKPPKWPP
jgi:hypothetical protein